MLCQQHVCQAPSRPEGPLVACLGPRRALARKQRAGWASRGVTGEVAQQASGPDSPEAGRRQEEGEQHGLGCGWASGVLVCPLRGHVPYRFSGSQGLSFPSCKMGRVLTSCLLLGLCDVMDQL